MRDEGVETLRRCEDDEAVGAPVVVVVVVVVAAVVDWCNCWS